MCQMNDADLATTNESKVLIITTVLYVHVTTLFLLFQHYKMFWYDPIITWLYLDYYMIVSLHV